MGKDKTVMAQIQTVEDTLRDSMDRVDVIERQLRTKLLTSENRERLETELEEVKEVLNRNFERLQSLRKENTRSFMVAAAAIFACFLIYGIFLMFFKD